MLTCAAMAIFFDKPGGRMCAIFMLFAIPFNTVLFFVAMYLSSIWFGAMEIGELHVAVIKAFILMVFISAINLTSFLTPFGGMFALPVLVLGIFVVFRLDPWEAHMLIFMNWLLNYALSFGLKVVLMGAMMGGMGHGKDRFDRDDREPPDLNWRQGDDRGGPVDMGGGGGPPAPEIWDEEDVKKRGGGVQFDPANPDDEVVIAISFRGGRVADADLVHMKDFPRLRRLDLTETAITDAGLLQLQACMGLRELTLTGTQVTDAGVQQLQTALPRLKIIR
jgi:hypothetical protein